MNRKFILFSAVAVASLVVVLAASAAAVFAFTVEAEPSQVDVIEVAPAIDVAPAQAEAPLAIQKPVINHQRANYEGGCAFSKARTQLTEVPDKSLEDAPVAQVAH